MNNSVFTLGALGTVLSFLVEVKDPYLKFGGSDKYLGPYFYACVIFYVYVEIPLNIACIGFSVQPISRLSNRNYSRHDHISTANADKHTYGNIPTGLLQPARGLEYIDVEYSWYDWDGYSF